MKNQKKNLTNGSVEKCRAIMKYSQSHQSPTQKQKNIVTMGYQKT
jgi:hypothetical protein